MLVKQRNYTKIYIIIIHLSLDKKDMNIHHTWIHHTNQEFDLHQRLIFSKSEWSTLDEIFSSIIEEEI
jgi:hypothetical protein